MFQTDLEVLKRAVLLCMISIRFCTADTHMTMELDSVDDQYINCRDSMLQKVLEPGGLLETELKADPDYWEMWEFGRTCMKPVPGAGDEQKIALAIFTSNFAEAFYYKFNNAMRLLGTNADIYNSKFPYKSLHFLLTDVFRLMKKTKNCYEGISGSYTNFASTEINTKVRMGHYTWGSPFMEGLCATQYLVKSCHAVDVLAYSCNSDVYVVIPPYEMFNVTKVQVIDDHDVFIKKVIISLTSAGTYHKHDCTFFTRTTATTPSTTTTSPGSCVLPPTWGLLVLLVVSLCLTSPDQVLEARQSSEMKTNQGPESLCLSLSTDNQL